MGLDSGFISIKRKDFNHFIIDNFMETSIQNFPEKSLDELPEVKYANLEEFIYSQDPLIQNFCNKHVLVHCVIEALRKTDNIKSANLFYCIFLVSPAIIKLAIENYKKADTFEDTFSTKEKKQILQSLQKIYKHSKKHPKNLIFFYSG